MSVSNKSLGKWQKVAGIGLACGLALAGCDRSEKEQTTETAEINEQETVTTENVAAAVNCDDPMVQDRLKTALKNTLNQQAQTLAANYANEAEISLSSGVVSNKVKGILIDVQNVAVLQAANDSGMTTCQASVSMTLPSEDLYQASQVQAANNQPSLQSRLAQNNIRINNNMLVDDAFTYIVGTQGGQVRTRIAGQPAMLTVVADVMAGSVFQSAIEQQRAERRTAQNNSSQSSTVRQPREVTPVEPIRPATPPTINRPSSNSGNDSSNNSSNSSSNNQSNNTDNSAAPAAEAKKPVTQGAPKSVPKDESIDMVIIEDDTATY